MPKKKDEIKQDARGSELPDTPCSASKDVEEWLKSGEYLPAALRDFHDQKDVFKAMHAAYEGDDVKSQMPSWIDGHCYTIDWFLWYMGRRGYTLRKSRAKVNFISP